VLGGIVKMETKIIFLILALLAVFILFSSNGQTWLRRYVGIDVTDRVGKDQATKQTDDADSGMVRA
jgi:hypothetical protein